MFLKQKGLSYATTTTKHKTNKQTNKQMLPVHGAGI